MNRYRLSSHRSLTAVVVGVAIAGTLVAGLGACQKEQTGTTTPPAEQSMKTPAPPENTSNTTNNTQQTDQSSGTGQKSQ